MGEYYHAIEVDSDKCMGSMYCMRVCPTEAIRIREGKALILEDRCIDCGDCIRVCPNRAIRSITGSFEDLSKFKYTIAIPSPCLYAQYGIGVTPNHILNGLKGLAFDEAYDIVTKALQPLGDDYVNTVKMATQNRWIDVYPSPGKRAGAYSNGSAYDVHPYILLNYNGQYDDLSTLAHELGHTLHSYYSNKNQPYPTADYSIFVAEVASTFYEALLIDKMLKDIKDDDIRLSLLMNYLDGIKGTVFRQTQFAEFELLIHQKAERGEPLTGDILSQLYGDILKRYYGHDKGVCNIDELYDVEWAYVPHFYYNFYVYQYSTSFTASMALSEKVLNKEKGAVKKYIKFISEYPIDLLRQAGVDMTTAEPFNKTMAVMNRTMDEIEAILDRKAK